MAEKLWIRRNPEAPWFTPESVRILDGLLRPTDIVFEWGAGRSTRWFAQRCARITSIENDPTWHARVEDMVRDLDNARSVLIPVEAGLSREDSKPYWTALGTVEPGPVDVVVIDGRYRDHCAVRAVDFVAPGGLLIVDDAQRRLPSNSRSPTARAGFASVEWREFAGLIADWRTIWTTSGVTDTAIWIRPPSDFHAPP